MVEPKPEPSSLRDAGRQRRERAQGAKAAKLQATVEAMDPGVADYVDEFVFGQIWGRPGLSHEERMLVAISALAATEHPNQLRNYLHGAIQDGIDPRKVHEALVMISIYGGFPAAFDAMAEWTSVVRSARSHGLNVDVPIE